MCLYHTPSFGPYSAQELPPISDQKHIHILSFKWVTSDLILNVPTELNGTTERLFFALVLVLEVQAFTLSNSVSLHPVQKETL